MALSNVFIALAILGTIFVPFTLAKEYVVGDNKGWSLNFDYQAWAQGKEFYVGDKLVFNYPRGVHNVLKVNGTGFQQCLAPQGTVTLATGNDIVELTSPGRKWYICGIGNHCESGNMKLVITVWPQAASPATSPPPAAAENGSAASKYNALILALFGLISAVIIL